MPESEAWSVCTQALVYDILPPGRIKVPESEACLGPSSRGEEGARKRGLLCVHAATSLQHPSSRGEEGAGKRGLQCVHASSGLRHPSSREE